MMYVFLILGFLLLIKGADYFVEASSSVARALRIPSIIIGLTIVAFGTSAPELSVSISASIAGNNDIAVGWFHDHTGNWFADHLCRSL